MQPSAPGRPHHARLSRDSLAKTKSYRLCTHTTLCSLPVLHSTYGAELLSRPCVFAAASAATTVDAAGMPHQRPSLSCMLCPTSLSDPETSPVPCSMQIWNPRNSSGEAFTPHVESFSDARSSTPGKVALTAPSLDRPRPFVSFLFFYFFISFFTRALNTGAVMLRHSCLNADLSQAFPATWSCRPARQQLHHHQPARAHGKTNVPRRLR